MNIPLSIVIIIVKFCFVSCVFVLFLINNLYCTSEHVGLFTFEQVGLFL